MVYQQHSEICQQKCGVWKHSEKPWYSRSTENPFHFSHAITTTPGQAVKSCTPPPNHLTVLSELQEYRPFSRGHLEWKPLRREPSYSIWTMSNHLDCIQELLSDSKCPPCTFWSEGSVCCEWWRWFGDVFSCCRNWQLMSDWLQSNSENQSSEESPRFGGACRCQAQARTRGQGTWQASPTQQLRKLPLWATTDCTTHSHLLHDTDESHFHSFIGIEFNTTNVCIQLGMMPSFFKHKWLSPVPYCVFTNH